MIRFGLVGCGQIAQKYAQLFNEMNEIKLEKVYDIDKIKAENISKLTNSKVSINVRDLLTGIDALIIATPPSSHKKFALMAANKKIHLFIEKPIATTLKETKQIINVCKINGCILRVNFQYRQSKIFKLLIDKNAIKQFGEIAFVNFKMAWLRDENYYSGWRANKKVSGGGVIINQAIHFIDFAIGVFGVPDNIYCRTKKTKFKEIQVEDTAFVLFEYKNGPFIYFRLSTGTYPDLHDELEISGTRGEIKVESVNEGGKIVFKQFLGQTNSFDIEPYENKLVNNKLTLQEFVHSIKNKSNRLNEIYATMYVVDKIYESDRKKQVVKA